MGDRTALLPPWLKQFLQALGINTVRLEWKLRYWRENWSWDRTPFARWAKILAYKHKFCKCGLLVDKDAKVCPRCGETVQSRTAYRLGRALGFIAPEAGVAWPGLLLAIGAVFFFELRLDGLAALGSPTSPMLGSLGALIGKGISHGGEIWRLLSAGLIHIGLIHILFNSMALSQLAPAQEDEIGPWKFIVLVTATQIGCTLLSYAYHVYTVGDVYSAGASGIAFGLIGFGLAYSHRRGGRLGANLRDLYIKWAIYGFLFGLFIGADNAGHLGGLAAGVAFGFLLPDPESEPAALAWFWRALALVCLVAWAYTLFSMAQSVAHWPPDWLVELARQDEQYSLFLPQ